MEPWDIRDREEVVREFCKIGGTVTAHFKYRHAGDCFCGDNRTSSDPGWRFRYSKDVIAFVRDAVDEKIAREAGGDDGE